MALDIQAILKPQRPQLFVAQQALPVPLELAGELRGSFLEALYIEIAGTVHDDPKGHESDVTE